MLENLIKSYEPYDEIEAADKKVILDFIDSFDDVLSRENQIGHFTSSAWVVNKDRSKVVMIYHNIYDSWGWTGGHADGDADLLKVALKEVEEETGLKNIKPITNELFALDILTVIRHVKKGKQIPSHLHLNTTFLIEADENESLVSLPSENSDVKWIEIDKVIEYTSEEHMKPVYSKLINKIKQL